MGVAMVLVNVVNGVGVHDRRLDFRDDAVDEADRRVGLSDPGILQVLEEQAGADDVGGMLSFAGALASPPRAPRDMVRIATASPAAPCAGSVPAAPISTSSGCAPMASTLSRTTERAARPLATSVATLLMKSTAGVGLCRNSTADDRRR